MMAYFWKRNARLSRFFRRYFVIVENRKVYCLNVKPKKAEKHKLAGAKYGDVRRSLEELS